MMWVFVVIYIIFTVGDGLLYSRFKRPLIWPRWWYLLPGSGYVGAIAWGLE